MILHELGSKEGVTVVELSGHMGLTAVQEIEREFKKATAGKDQSVVVDMHGVDYISSFGVRLFLDVIQELEKKGKKMVFVAPSPDVEKVLLACEMDTLAGLEKDVASAIAKAKS